MNRFLYSMLFLICLTPFQFGCGGEEEPLHKEEDVDNQIDPESEEEALKELNK
ncbi:MAG: hypothetical protein ACIAZJ_23425 [Gimesia chilikensis]|uniref:hypothetical protein n=1 Tax=Gimesia chilikensis TaxID=2605989 RepID=UPI0037B5F047